MSDTNQPADHSEFELTAEMLDQWEQELDSFQQNIHDRLSLLNLKNNGTSDSPNETTALETRSPDDAVHLADSLNELLK